ncbi:tyrosine-type recombinase/integrase [Niallia endozanthoxylica]|uniref:Tyrosine-type recombinase/integrase n=1 Tax=Niallia endozanthoxylica TaxID=2036016 RepID=A0A5J5H2U9_9BACI|nr:tyrosine-type recombinase/integrase [Niallia endozanthoxylica]KAA9014909.1 tyrosine-type recombinase/integrase [Niallia endozanthoxylica]
MLLSKAWETYESDKRIEGFSPKTLKAYKLQSALLIRFVKDVQLDTITTEQLKSYVAKPSENLKPASLAHRIRFMKSLFRWSHKEEHIPQNPSAKIKEPKTGKGIPKFLIEMEIEHLREACCTPMEMALFKFMFSTEYRIGEIVSLDRCRINWSNRSAIIRGKGDKKREVYFNIPCEIWLKRYLNNREDRDTAIFVTERDPHRMSIAQMQYIIKQISNRASNNKDIHPHQLKHNNATHLLHYGAPLDVIQNLLSHEKLHATEKAWSAKAYITVPYAFTIWLCTFIVASVNPASNFVNWIPNE